MIGLDTDVPVRLFAADDATRRAARWRRGGDIPDHVVAPINRAAGCRATMTFDEDAARNPDSELLAA